MSLIPTKAETRKALAATHGRASVQCSTCWRLGHNKRTCNRPNRPKTPSRAERARGRAAEVLKRYEAGGYLANIARDVGVSLQLARNIITGRLGRPVL